MIYVPFAFGDICQHLLEFWVVCGLCGDTGVGIPADNFDIILVCIFLYCNSLVFQGSAESLFFRRDACVTERYAFHSVIH